MPDVPTIAESGLPAHSVETWFMVIAPAGIPRPILEKVNASLNVAIGSTKLKERMLKEDFEPIPGTPAQARSRLERELPRWAKLVKERGISAD